MKPNFIIPSFLLFALCFFFSNINAQKIDVSKLLGKWVFERYEFIDMENDTAEMKRLSQGLVLCFENGNKFITTMKMEGGETEVVKGTYKVSSDGKYLIQNGEKAQMLKLDDKEFVFKLPEVIIHLKRLR